MFLVIAVMADPLQDIRSKVSKTLDPLRNEVNNLSDQDDGKFFYMGMSSGSTNLRYVDVQLTNPNSYQYIKAGCVDPGNAFSMIYYAQNKTIQDCKAMCDDYGTQCVSFEYGVNYNGSGTLNPWEREKPNPGDCVITSDPWDKTCNGTQQNVDLYVKIDQNETIISGFPLRLSTTEYQMGIFTNECHSTVCNA